MKRSWRLLAILSFLIIAGSLAFHSSEQESTSAKAGHNPKLLSKTGTNSLTEMRALEAESSRTKKRRIGYIYGAGLPRFYLSEFQKYLNDCNWSCESMVGVYNLTGDLSLLDELKKHTDNAEAMLCVALKTTGEEAKHFAELYSKLVPDHMSGHILLAAALTSGGSEIPENEDEFISIVKNGMNSEFLSFGFDQSEQCARDALNAIGTDPLDAEAMLMSVSSGSDVVLLYQRRVLMLSFTMQLENAVDLDQRISIAKDYLSTTQSIEELTSYSSYNHGGDHHVSIRNLILSSLPSDVYLGDDYGTVEDLKKKYNNNYGESNKRKEDVANILMNASLHVLDQFLVKRREEGPQLAQKWLLDRSNYEK